MAGPGLAHLERIASLVINLELRMRMLDNRDGITALGQFADKADHQGGLARVLPPRDAEKRGVIALPRELGCRPQRARAARLILKNGSIRRPPISIA